MSEFRSSVGFRVVQSWSFADVLSDRCVCLGCCVGGD